MYYVFTASDHASKYCEAAKAYFLKRIYVRGIYSCYGGSPSCAGNRHAHKAHCVRMCRQGGPALAADRDRVGRVGSIVGNISVMSEICHATFDRIHTPQLVIITSRFEVTCFLIRHVRSNITLDMIPPSSRHLRPAWCSGRRLSRLYA